MIECAQAVKEESGQYNIAVPRGVHVIGGWNRLCVWINEDGDLAMP